MAKYFTIPLSLTLAVTACAPENAGSGGGTDTDGGEGELTLGKGSRALAITSDALYFERDGGIVRFDRSTEEEEVLVTNAAVVEWPGVGSVLGVNHSRVFYLVDDADEDSQLQHVHSVPLDGGESRLEVSFDGKCVGRCFAVTDDTLFGFAGGDGSAVLAVDLASGEATELVAAPFFTNSVTVDETTLFGAGCNGLWSFPLEGGEILERGYEGGNGGCVAEIATDGPDLYFIGSRGLDGPVEESSPAVLRAPVDSLVPEVVIDIYRDTSAFVVREGVVFARVDGSIVRFDEGGQQELAPANTDWVTGMAVEGDDLYWIDQGGTIHRRAL